MLGAGISGLAAAYELEKSAGDYRAFESAEEVGGLCKSVRYGDYLYDTVSHVLHFQDRRIREFVEGLFEEPLLQVARRAFVHHEGRMVPYPYQMHLGFLPVPAMAAAVAGLLAAKASREKAAPANFEEWISREFGAGIAQQFMLPYNRKMWGVEPSEMSTDWMRFVPKTSLAAVMSSLISKNRGAGYNASFLYPPGGGIRKLMEALAERCAALETSRRVAHVDVREKTVRLDNGETVAYQRLINTMDLPQFSAIASGLSEGSRRNIARLRSTSLLSIVICTRTAMPNDAHWVYFADPGIPFFRLFFASNVNPAQAPAGGGIISAEISNPSKEPAAVEEAVTEKLMELGYLRAREDIVHTERHFFEKAYPVHTLDRKELLAPVMAELDEAGIRSIGRFGGWKYGSIEDCILEARDAVRDLAAPSVAGSGEHHV